MLKTRNITVLLAVTLIFLFVWGVSNVTTAYADVLGKNMPEHVFRVTTGGGVSNPKRVSAGDAAIGVTTTDIAYAAYKGVAPYDKPQNVRALGTLYRQPYQIVAVKDRGLRHVRDLRNARIVAGKPGTSGEAMTKKFLGLLGYTYESIKAAGGQIHFTGYGDATGLMRDNLADLHMVGSALPTPYFEEVNVVRELVVLIMPDDIIKKVLETTPGTFAMVIPKGTYKGMDQDVKTFGNAILYVVNADLPEGFVYRLTKVLFENTDAIGAVSATVKKDLKLQNALEGVKIPLHPGAEKYYREKGLKK
jgi:TRAP transporter TAXI family solute receptor